MSKAAKRIGLPVIIGASVLLLSSCSITKAMCTPTDRTQQYYSYYVQNIVENKENEDGTFEIVYDDNLHTSFSKTYIEKVGTSYLLPSKEFTNYIDDQVNSYIKVDSNFTDVINNISEQKDGSEQIEEKVKRGIALFGGFTSDPSKVELWSNFDKWTNEFNEQNKGNLDLVPSNTFITQFKNEIAQANANNFACITPSGGLFQNGNTFVEGKTWGEAFTEFGFFEGLFVYPISVMLDFFSNAFGNQGIGQIFAIFLVTLIVRMVLIIFTIFTSKSQNKINELQPEVALLQQKYPNADSDPQQKRALAMEQQQLYKKNKVHPFLQLLVLFIQMPIFIFVWSALQGSAILTNGQVFGLTLTSTISSHFFNNPNAFAIILFIMLCVSQFISTQLPMWFSSWQTKKFVRQTVVSTTGQKQQKTMKYVSLFMTAFICFMGFSLVAAMAIYWFFGALISIAQTLFMQLASKIRRRKGGKGGDGSTLAAQRRSKHNDNLKVINVKTRSIRSSR